jgi:hypothetical protein
MVKKKDAIQVSSRNGEVSFGHSLFIWINGRGKTSNALIEVSSCNGEVCLLTTLSVLRLYIVGWLMTDDLGRIWKEAVVIEVLS